MKKKLSIVTLLTIVMTMCFGMTAFASPKTMPDGTVFDAEYYAKTYPDVASAIGTDENTLYQHYVMAGKAEGRHPVAPAQTTTSTTTASLSGIDTALAEIQKRIVTGAVPITRNVTDFENYDTIARFNADDDIDSYLQPILEVCAKNGYKYQVICSDFTESCYNNDYEKYSIRGVAVTNSTVSTRNWKEDPDTEDIIRIYVEKYKCDYTQPGFSALGKNVAPVTHKKNDIKIGMLYGGFLDKSYDDFHIIGEIPVN